MSRYVLKTEPANSTAGVDEIIVSDATPLPVTGVAGATANVAIHGNANPTWWLEPNSDGSVNIKSADGAQVTLGATTDASTALTVIGLLKAIKAAVQGTLTVGGSVAVSNFPATQPVSGTVGVNNFPATQPVSAAALPLPTGASTAALQPPVTLMSRMLAKVPQSGWDIWLDTADTSYIYIMEAVVGATATSTGIQGIRLPLDANGNVLGQFQVNTSITVTWNTRKTDGNWA